MGLFSMIFGDNEEEISEGIQHVVNCLEQHNKVLMEGIKKDLHNESKPDINYYLIKRHHNGWEGCAKTVNNVSLFELTKFLKKHFGNAIYDTNQDAYTVKLINNKDVFSKLILTFKSRSDGGGKYLMISCDIDESNAQRVIEIMRAEKEDDLY